MHFHFPHSARFRGLLALILCVFVVTAHSLAAAPAHSHQAQIQTHAGTATEVVAGKGKAAGNGTSGTGKAEGILAAEVVLLLVVGRLLGEGMQRLGQPALMGQLLAGIVLGPSLFGWIWPEAQKFLFPSDPAQKSMIDGLSQIGILMLLLLTGMETDLKLVRKSGFAAVAIALSGIALPFACGFLMGQFLPSALLPAGDRLVPSLFLGTALSISSIKIVAMVVREMNFMRRDLGQIIVATAIMEDTVGWVIIAITFGIAGAGGGSKSGVDYAGLAKTVGGIVLFLLFCFTAGRWLVFTAIRWVNDNFRSEFPVITVILVITGLMAIATQLLGVRTVLGAFMAGVLIGESPILTAHIQQELRGLITAFFMPIFFGMSGLAADLTILKDPRIALFTVGLVATASVGKFSGAFLGSVLGRLKWREGIALGCAMNARGSTEVIVASIGLSMGALTQNLYTMIVTMAVITTMAMPPMLRAALLGLPMSPQEKTRVEREALDEKGFVSNLERLLIAVDSSPLGHMAARLAGLVAGAHGMPVTMLKLENDLRQADAGAKKSRDTDAGPKIGEHDAQSSNEKDSKPKTAEGALSVAQTAAEMKADPIAREVQSGANAGAAKMIADEAEPDPEKVHITSRVPADRPADVVKDESRKGYDMLFIGIEQGISDEGEFTPEMEELAAGFNGPLALLAHGGTGPLPKLFSRNHILLPVNGTPASRHAAEIAFAISRAIGGRATLLFVSRNEGHSRTLRGEESMLKDLSDLAERYGVPVTTRISKRGAAAEEILQESKAKYDMIVMGVSPRPGEELFFGNTASAILKGARQPVLLIAS